MLTFILRNSKGGDYGLMAKHSLGWYTGAGNFVCVENVVNLGDWHIKGISFNILFHNSISNVWMQFNDNV